MAVEQEGLVHLISSISGLLPCVKSKHQESGAFPLPQGHLALSRCTQTISNLVSHEKIMGGGCAHRKQIAGLLVSRASCGFIYSDGMGSVKAAVHLCPKTYQYQPQFSSFDLSMALRELSAMLYDHDHDNQRQP
jgi:hypothetical protein